jgi:hypothetical protein
VLLKTGSSDLKESDTQQGTDIVAKVAMMPPRYPYIRSAPGTHAVFYDISDREHPKVLKDYTIDGDYVNARMIGSTVYLLSRESVYPFNDRIIVPAVRENAKIVATPDVYYFDNPEKQYDFTTVTSFDASNGATKDAKTYLVGSCNTLYVSPNAMYVSYQKYNNVYRPMREFAEPALDVVQGSIGSAAGIARASSPALVEDFNTMSDSERQAVIAEMKSGSRNQSANARSTRALPFSIRLGSTTVQSPTSRKGRCRDTSRTSSQWTSMWVTSV